MYYSYRPGGYSGLGAGFYQSKAVKTLIIINVSVFLLMRLWPRFPWILLAMVPRLVFSHLMVWQLVTYMFLHAGLWHLAINMLMLWFFGPAIEEVWGRRQFLFYYFFTGIGAALCSFIFSFRHPIIGASGAIFGLLVAYAMMFPETVVLVFFLFPMKIKHAVLLFAGINLWNAVGSSGSGIAYFAHLGGGLFGYLYLKSEWLKIRISRFSLSEVKAFLREKTKQRRVSFRQDKDIDKRVDEILDKISKHGMQSLTKSEREILKQRSRSKPS